MDKGTERYQAHEFNVDAFGSGSIGQTTIEHLSGSRIRDNGRLGAGVGIGYFFTRNVGVGVDSASVNLLVRFPLGNCGLSYVLGGGSLIPLNSGSCSSARGWNIASPRTSACSSMAALSSRMARRTTACSVSGCVWPSEQSFPP